MKLNKWRTRKRFLATVLCVAMAVGLPNVPMFNKTQVKAEGETNAATVISEDFESGDLKGTAKGLTNEDLTKVEEAHSGKYALKVSNRGEDSWKSYQYDISNMQGKMIKIQAYMKIASSNIDLVGCATDERPYTDGGIYDWAVCGKSVANEWVEIVGLYKVKDGVKTIYFQTNSTEDYLIDDVTITETAFVKEDFNSYENIDSLQGKIFPQGASHKFDLLNVGTEEEKNKALSVTNRGDFYVGYSYDFKAFAGNKINVSCDVKLAEEGDPQQISGSLKLLKKGQEDGEAIYPEVVSGAAITNTQFTHISADYDVPADYESYTFYFNTLNEIKCGYVLDNILVTVVGDYKPVVKDPASDYVDTSKYPKLKELYKDDFKVGVACEAISHWNNQLSEIGNPIKEAFIKSQFDCITFGNELKPEYNMDVTNKSGERTDTNVPFAIQPAAQEMLDWAKTNGIAVRGHTLLWHSQVAEEIFCKNYTKVYVDPNAQYKVLDPSCFVDKETLKARMTSYVKNVLKWMYDNGYADIIYGWDVVNEAIDPGAKNTYMLRDSYWYKILGDDWMYYAFQAAREAVDAYALNDTLYPGITDVKDLQPKLFYNDFNENESTKCDAIIRYFTTAMDGHMSIKEAGYIDGMGMQGHIGDNVKVAGYIDAMKKYSNTFGEVNVTELDIEQKSTGVNADYYQGMAFYNLYKAMIEAKNDGVNLTSVTIWGLTDDNSWKKQTKPLIFRGDLSQKLAFTGIVYAKTGGEMPEPAYEAPDFKDIIIDFEGEDVDLEALGLSARGDGTVSVQNEVVHSGKAALKDTGRTTNWHGTYLDVSKFAGQTFEISAWVKTEDPFAKLSVDLGNAWPCIDQKDIPNGEWTQLYGTYKIPVGMTTLKVYIEAGPEGATSYHDIYVDDIKVKLLEMKEDFEEDSNIAVPRSAGHMPVITVTDTESHNGSGHSLLVSRTENDATMSFDVSKYIGKTINVKAFVKTNDSKIKLGLDGETPKELDVKDSNGDWTEVSTTFQISNTLTSAAMYIETNGIAEFYVDDIIVTMAEYVEDMEKETYNIDVRWNGAGTITRVEDNGGHAACLTGKDQTYYGLCFDVQPFIGMQVEISADVKTDDDYIKLSTQLGDTYPCYMFTTSDKGKYKTVKAFISLPSDTSTLKLYFETNGINDVYVDNIKIKRVPIGKEYKVDFVAKGEGETPASQLLTEGSLVAIPIVPNENFVTCDGYFKDARCTQPWDMQNDRVTADTTIYVKYPGFVEPGNSGGVVIPTYDDPSQVKPTEPAEKPGDKPGSKPATATANEPVVNDTETARTITYDASAVNVSAKKNELKKALKDGKDVTYEFTNKEGEVTYSLTFDADKYNKDTKVKNVKLDVKVDSAANYGFENGTMVSLAQKGKLGMELSLKVNVSDQFKAGDKVYLYIYNKGAKKLDCVPNNKYVVDKDGFVDLSIVKGANYVLLPKAAAKADKKSVASQVQVSQIGNLKKGQKDTIQVTLPDTLMKVSSLKKFDAKSNHALYGATVTFKSSDKKIASVDKKGVIKAKKKGTVTITTEIKLSNGSKKIVKEEVVIL